MKTIIILTASLLLVGTSFSYAQAPQRVNYQTIVRDASGQPLTNQAIALRLTVRQSTAAGTIQYQETHNLSSNAQALVNLQIGAGTVNSGTFAAITWADGQAKFLQIELDPDGAGAQPFANMGAQQLVSVPYAIHSENTKWIRVSGNNVAVGPTNYNLSGFNNTASGNNALYSNTTGGYNTASGRGALFSNTEGHNNTASGSEALFANTEGHNNTASGSGALFANTTGNYNTASGYYALYFNTEGDDNTASGGYALFSNTIGSSNTATGGSALFSNTIGSSNTATGGSALYSNTIGSSNTATGYDALAFNTIGSENTAHGTSALRINTEGINNTAAGYGALYENIIGNDNTASGWLALRDNTASGNTATGSGALRYNTTGDYNTASGYNALSSNTTGDYNSCVGYNSNVSVNNLIGASAFGQQAITNANNKIVLGANTAGMVIGGYASWSNLSDGRFKQNVQGNVPGLSFIKQLQPVTYTIDINKLQHHITAQMPDSIAQRYYPSAEQIAAANTEIRTGFIAQEVEAAAKKMGYTFDGVNTPQNPTDTYSIAYAGFVPSLVKAIQEQQASIEQQQMIIDKQQISIEQLQSELNQIKQLLNKQK